MSYPNYHSTQSFADYSFAIITGTLFFTFLIVGNFVPGLSHLLFLMFGFPLAVNAGIFSLGLGAIYRGLFQIAHPDLLTRHTFQNRLDIYIVEHPGTTAFVISVALVFLTTAILTSVFHISLLAILASHLSFLSSFSNLVSSLSGVVTSALIEGTLSSTLTAAILGTIVTVKTLFSTQTIQTKLVVPPSNPKSKIVPPTPKTTATNPPLKASPIQRSSSAPVLTILRRPTEQMSETATPPPSTKPTNKLPTPKFAQVGPSAGAAGHLNAATPISIPAKQVEDASSSEPTTPTSFSYQTPRLSTSHRRAASVGNPSPLLLERIPLEAGETVEQALARHTKNPFGSCTPVSAHNSPNPFGDPVAVDEPLTNPSEGDFFGSCTPVSEHNPTNPFGTPVVVDESQPSARTDDTFESLSPLPTTPITRGDRSSHQGQENESRRRRTKPVPFPGFDDEAPSPLSTTCASQLRQQPQGDETGNPLVLKTH